MHRVAEDLAFRFQCLDAGLGDGKYEGSRGAGIGLVCLP